MMQKTYLALQKKKTPWCSRSRFPYPMCRICLHAIVAWRAEFEKATLMLMNCMCSLTGRRDVCLDIYLPRPEPTSTSKLSLPMPSVRKASITCSILGLLRDPYMPCTPSPPPSFLYKIVCCIRIPYVHCGPREHTISFKHTSCLAMNLYKTASVFGCGENTRAWHVRNRNG